MRHRMAAVKLTIKVRRFLQADPMNFLTPRSFSGKMGEGLGKGVSIWPGRPRMQTLRKQNACGRVWSLSYAEGPYIQLLGN